MNELFPWQVAPWQGLIRRLREDCLPHALLLAGPRGLGKTHFARLFAQALLCGHPDADKRDGLPCGQCRGCLLSQAGTHPDNRQVGLLEDKKVIGVDQVREIGDYLTMKAHYSGYKVVVVAPAEQMNVQAANSLLKILEEPAPRSLLVLVASNASALPATVRSRCQRVTFTIPPDVITQPWLAARLEAANAGDAGLLLALAGGAPLAALEMAQGSVVKQRLALLDDMERLARGQVSAVAIAAAWLKFEMSADETLYWVHSWLVDMIRLKSAQHPPVLANQDVRQRLQAIAARVDLKGLYRQLDRVAEASRLAAGQSNPQMLLENLLIIWMGCFSGKVSKGSSESCVY